jgi:glycerophosphoryl diester phosphodiesterase
MTASRPRTGFAFLDEPHGPIAFAHRGGATHAGSPDLENTMAAFRHAVGLGYRYLETDVHVTRDGVLLAFHDPVLDRVTDGTGELLSLSAEEVMRFRVGGRERVPTFAELYDAFPDARFNIDLKSTGAGAVLADFIARADAWDRVLVGSFERRRLHEFRRLTGGRVATSAHPAEVAAFLLAPGPLLPKAPVALQIPQRRGRLVLVTPRLLRRAHDHGLHVHVWTVNDPAQMHDLLDLGVDGLITDRTDLLKQVLLERGEWQP